jgi:hypothetical protein
VAHPATPTEISPPSLISDLTKEAIRTAIDVTWSTQYGLLEKGTLITADNQRTSAADLSINRRSRDPLLAHRTRRGHLPGRPHRWPPFVPRPGQKWRDDDSGEAGGGFQMTAAP